MAITSVHRKPLLSLKFTFISIHVLIWAIILSLPYYIANPPNFNIGPLPGRFFTLASIIHALIFYLNAYYLYPKLLNYRLWWLYIIAIIALLLLSFQIKHLLLVVWFPAVIGDVSANKFIYPPSVGIFIASLIYRKIINKIREEKLQKEQQAEQLTSELKLLRSQINPHFLFNVLTNLVSLARKKSEKLETSLLMLSDLMHYTLYESQQDKVQLVQEIEYLNSYIELQKLRFGNEVNILTHIQTDDELEKYYIEPMLLVPFVENAFKHGTGWIDAPAITISLSTAHGVLTFIVANNYNDEQNIMKDKNSGIGLKNVKARLDLLYKGLYALKIEDSNAFFRIILTLKLT